MTSAQNINSQRARLWLPLDTQFRQDVGSNLVADGDMELPVATPPWSATNSSLSKQTDAPYSGTRYLLVSDLASAGVYWATQSILSNGNYYHIIAAARGDNARRPYVYIGTLGTLGFQGLVSSNWQTFDTIKTSTGSTFYLGCVGVGGAVGFDDVSVFEYPLTTRNLGGASGAPMYVRMGDGHTASTAPSQIVGSRGVRLDGGDYMRVPLDFDRSQAFTVAVLTNSPLSAAGWLAATYDSATARGIRFGSTGSRVLTAGIYDDGGRSITVTSPANAIPPGNSPRLFCVSYNGGLAPGSLAMSIDDVVVGGVGAGTALASSISSGRDMLIGARWNAATPTEIMAASSILWAGEFPTVLSMYELRLLKARLLREIRVGV